MYGVYEKGRRGFNIDKTRKNEKKREIWGTLLVTNAYLIEEDSFYDFVSCGYRYHSDFGRDTDVVVVPLICASFIFIANFFTNQGWRNVFKLSEDTK